jgi:hypothetical protein
VIPTNPGWIETNIQAKITLYNQQPRLRSLSSTEKAQRKRVKLHFHRKQAAGGVFPAPPRREGMMYTLKFVFIRLVKCFEMCFFSFFTLLEKKMRVEMLIWQILGERVHSIMLQMEITTGRAVSSSSLCLPAFTRDQTEPLNQP